jgi:hypothetical protein
MTHIVLTKQQAEVVSTAREPIHIQDDEGRVVGQIDPPHFTDSEIALARQAAAADPRRYSTAQVLASLLLLAEDERQNGPLTKARAHMLLESYRAQGKP